MKPPIDVCADCATEQQASVGLNDLTRICAIKAQLKAEQNVETNGGEVSQMFSNKCFNVSMFQFNMFCSEIYIFSFCAIFNHAPLN